MAGRCNGARRNYDVDVAYAIERFELRRRGWQGFEALPWVEEIQRLYPAIRQLAASASMITREFYEPAHQLFEAARTDDRAVIGEYFLGKLALEQLSCNMFGAGAGACDRRAAYLAIWEIFS